MWIRSQSISVAPVVGSELPRGAPLCMPMPLQLSSTQLDSSSSVSVSRAVFVRLVRARPALSLVSIPGVLVKTVLFPFLGTFQIMYVNTALYALGASCPRAYSWHLMQLELSHSGFFAADVS